jgi:hypothetical protein
MILIGSRAVEILNSSNNYDIHIPDKNADYDFISSKTELKNFLTTQFDQIKNFKKHSKYEKYHILLKDGRKLEIELIEETLEQNSSNELINEYVNLYIPHKYLELLPLYMVLVVDFNILYTIKKSHVHHNINWEKTIRDYHNLKKIVEKTELSSDQEKLLEKIFTQRKNETDQRNSSPQISLDMSNEEFFQKSEKYVHREIQHDRIHEYVMFGKAPLFKMFKKDQSKALMNMKMFENAPLETRLQCVQEECMALTLERYIIPTYSRHNNQLNYQKFYGIILKRMCINLSKGKFRQFVIDHYYDVLTCPKNLNDICATIQKDIYETRNPFMIFDILMIILNYLNYTDIYILSQVDSFFNQKLNNSTMKKKYYKQLYGIEMNPPTNYSTMLFETDMKKMREIKYVTWHIYNPQADEIHYLYQQMFNEIFPIIYYRVYTSGCSNGNKFKFITNQINNTQFKYSVKYSYFRNDETMENDDDDDVYIQNTITNIKHSATITCKNTSEVFNIEYNLEYDSWEADIANNFEITMNESINLNQRYFNFIIIIIYEMLSGLDNRILGIYYELYKLFIDNGTIFN